jgi:hypothetical protein
MPNHFFPPMPELGHSEKYYKLLAADAETNHSPHAREAAKVGQYVTLGITDDVSPFEKMKYFRHAIRRHCTPPPAADDVVVGFYERLAMFAREHAGKTAMKIASDEDDRFAMRLRDGELRPKVVIEARQFYERFLGVSEGCPECFNPEDWSHLRLMRDYWQTQPIDPDAA